MDPTGTGLPSGLQVSCHADRWERLSSCSREDGAAKEMRASGGRSASCHNVCVVQKKNALTAASVPEYVGASKRTLSPGLTNISNTCTKTSKHTRLRHRL